MNQQSLDNGWKSVELEPCVWVLYDGIGRSRGIAMIHVDGLVTAGNERGNDNRFRESLQALRQALQWDRGSESPSLRAASA